MKKKRSEWPPEGPKGVGRPSLKSGWGRKALPQVRKLRPQVREGSGGPPEGPGGVESSSRRTGWGREALLKVLEALPEVWEGSGGPFIGPGVVVRFFQRSGRILRRSERPALSGRRGRKAITKVWVG